MKIGCRVKYEIRLIQEICIYDKKVILEGFQQ